MTARVLRRRNPRRGGAALLGVAAPLLLAGLLPLQPGVHERWGWSGSWIHPVGDRYTMEASGSAPPFRIMRGVRTRGPEGPAHDGADLSNGRGGDPVVAAANGIVVRAAGKGWHRGFGSHVVLAHRFGDGTVVYSVYAHLAAGSVIVRQGQFVAAGRRLGRVGMTGRASSPHLHFEIRRAPDPGRRWEHAPAVDPVTFLAARLPGCRTDSTWARPYLEWAELAALIEPGSAADEAMTRGAWWRTLAAATHHPWTAMPEDADSLRRALVDAGLLSEGTAGGAAARLAWDELARDLARARRAGLRLPWSPTDAGRRRADCRRELDLASPARDLDGLEKAAAAPTRAAVCLALADLAGDSPRPKPKAKRPAPPATPPAASPDSVTVRRSG